MIVAASTPASATAAAESSMRRIGFTPRDGDGERDRGAESERADGVEVSRSLGSASSARASIARQLFFPAGNERRLAEAERAGEQTGRGEVDEAKDRFDGAVHEKIIEGWRAACCVLRAGCCVPDSSQRAARITWPQLASHLFLQLLLQILHPRFELLQLRLQLVAVLPRRSTRACHSGLLNVSLRRSEVARSPTRRRSGRTRARLASP